MSPKIFFPQAMEEGKREVMIFRAREFKFRFPRPALVMGIVNVTPDSFSDGGKFLAVEAAVAHARLLIAHGADILDLGGESTRPRAEVVSEEEEIRRVIPVIEALANSCGVPISIDTQKVGVARRALLAGASIVNDIAANRDSPEMWETVAEFNAGYVLMHMLGTPQTMQMQPTYADVVAEVGTFFEERMRRVGEAGLTADQIVLDVGIGFGKTLDHNLQLLSNLKRFTVYERPNLLGVSRKSFIGKLLGAELPERMPAGLACAVWGVLQGVNIVRTHEVKETVQAVRMLEAIMN